MNWENVSCAGKGGQHYIVSLHNYVVASVIYVYEYNMFLIEQFKPNIDQ